MVSKKIRLRLTDLIGKQIKVVEAKNKALEGIQGTVIDETKNTIAVQSKSGVKTLLKNQIKIMVDGQIITPVVARPWEIKKRWKKWRKSFRGEESSLE